MMDPSVTVTSLTKSYGRTPALSNLSFVLEPGSIYGLIGPNGAGKTTSLAILAGLIQATSGTAWILGREVRPGSPELVSRIGFFSPQFPYFDYLTGMEVLLTCGLMHRLALSEARRRARDLMTLLDLEPAVGRYLAHYSMGMRHKLGLACALIHAPDVLILDEPFVGMDPVSAHRLVCCFRRMAENGRTILLSSHDMARVQLLCHRVGVLHQGILKHEMQLPRQDNPGTTCCATKESDSSLETVLWEIVGMPEMEEIPWLQCPPLKRQPQE